MRWQRHTVLVLVLAAVMFPGLAAAEQFLAVYINPNNLSWASGQGDSLAEASSIAAESCGAGCRRAGYSRNACVALAIRDGDGTCWGCMWVGASVKQRKRH